MSLKVICIMSALLFLGVIALCSMSRPIRFDTATAEAEVTEITVNTQRARNGLKDFYHATIRWVVDDVEYYGDQQTSSFAKVGDIVSVTYDVNNPALQVTSPMLLFVYLILCFVVSTITSAIAAGLNKRKQVKA